MARHVTIHAFVRAPFDQYVHDDSLWWDASGISVKLDGGGVKVQLESIKALLLGGIAFETDPDRKSATEQARHAFPLYANREAAHAAGFGRKIRMVSFFQGSVAGLDVGADVTLHGLKIGEVTELGLRFDPKTQRHRRAGPLHDRGRPHRQRRRCRQPAGRPGRQRDDPARLPRHPRHVEPADRHQGGGDQADPRCAAGHDRHRRRRFRHPVERMGGLDSITAAAAELLTKINRIDFEAIGAGLAGTAKGLDGIVNGPQLKHTLESLERDDGRRPGLRAQARCRRRTGDGPAAGHRQPARQCAHPDQPPLASLNTGYGGDSRFNRELDRLMPQLNEAVRSFRALADLLSRHPEALIKGRTNTGKE